MHAMLGAALSSGQESHWLFSRKTLRQRLPGVALAFVQAL